MAKQNLRTIPTEVAVAEPPIGIVEHLPLWQLDIGELTGHNLEARGREEVNRLLREGWRLLHIYTLKYEEDGVWRERPMAVLGRLRSECRTDEKRSNSKPSGGHSHDSTPADHIPKYEVHRRDPKLGPR